MGKLAAIHPYYLAGQATMSRNTLPVVNKYSGAVVAEAARADRQAVEKALAAAVAAARAMRALPTYRRHEILEFVRAGIQSRAEEFAQVLTIETGKAIVHARLEVARALDTLRIAAMESMCRSGEYLPLDINERTRGWEGFWQRVPVGPVGCVVPFNFPLNLALHKIAPAIAIGCPFLLKPASNTPLSALMLGEVLAAAGLPEGAFSIFPALQGDAELLATDPRVKLFSFTGSPTVGWELKKKAGKKKVALELGGNAACIVDCDADIARAAERIVFGAFYQSGQSCISVQRIIAHASIYEKLRTALVRGAESLRAGDPLEEQTFLGPMISEAEARRVEEWVNEARAAGATVISGGDRDGAFYTPTLLEDVPRSCRISCREVFGPVAVLSPFEDFRAAVEEVNASEFGLQAGVFTRDLHRAHYAYREIDCGTVVVNDIPSVRVDSMPYGGVKDSGAGREGVRFAMEEMSEIRLMLLAGAGTRL